MNGALTTLAEQSAFAQTGGTEEVGRLCAAFSARWPEVVTSFEFGQSAEGRPLYALLVSRSGVCTPQQLKERRIPLLMLQAGIHPGESDGKDAGFIALRELLEQTPARVLEQLAILFVPAFNADGHERTGRWNRPNQNGPEVTGWRTTAENLNLNRDYTKADAPEMRSMLALIERFDPIVCADLHVTDGADFQPDISIQVEPINQGAPELWPAGRALRDALIDSLAQQGSLPLSFYPDLYETDNPQSGFILTVYSPRFSTGYFAQRNRFTVLVETHSWKPYARRVQVMRNCIAGLAQLTAERGTSLIEQAESADAQACQLGGAQMPVNYKSSWREPSAAGKTAALEVGPQGEQIEFPGYAYTRTRSALSGGWVTAYDATTPAVWRVPLRTQIEPSQFVRAPTLGYFIPRAYARDLGPRLACHGISSGAAPTPEARAVRQFVATEVSFATRPFEGRMRVTLAGEWQPYADSLPAGCLFVPIEQKLARLVVALLDPQAPDSFAAWGFFNACFEQKEQLEPYVAEQIAHEIYRSDAAVRAEFAHRLATDEAFAADPAARLEFFCRRHPSWDRQFNCYPILRA